MTSSWWKRWVTVPSGFSVRPVRTPVAPTTIARGTVSAAS